MEQGNSILEKVLENKQAENLDQFDPQAVLSLLFSELNDREIEVLTRRFGLGGEAPQTLEVIGRQFGVTRERVRQIETHSIKKLHKLDILAEQLKQVETVLYQVLDQHGGILEESHMLDLVLEYKDSNSKNRAILLFIIDKLLHSQFAQFYHIDNYHRSWKLATVNEDKVTSMIKQILSIMDSHGEPITEEELISKIMSEIEDVLHEMQVQGHLRISKKLKQNIFDHWGKAEWNSITPKRMNDKIFLVLGHVDKPLHFTEIADKINELKFDHKTAYPATVHNELILDDKYVLVGRGIYALSKWGYQPGVVADVIIRILKDSERPLAREDIVEEVLKQRIVGKSTIHLALMNKERFSKLDDGRYTLHQLAS